MLLNRTLSDRSIGILEIIIILIFSLIPLFFNFPYRINIFLSYEGAYRLYLGHLPYQDFGLPLGYAYWLIPALFFKLFGPTMYSLIIAQSFLNLVALFCFRWLLHSFGLTKPQSLIAIIIFCLSYIFINFWPWYNNTVFIYQLAGLAFLVRGLLQEGKVKNYIFISFGGLFTFLSFFTKQDGGGLALLVAGALLAYHAIFHKKWSYLLVFIAAYFLSALAFIGPFLDNGFFYWFNYGQAPHSSRLQAMDFLQMIFYQSQWIKFYLLFISLIVMYRVSNSTEWLKDKTNVTFSLLTLGILIQALIVQVTSYIPHNVNIYFHSFAAAFVLKELGGRLPLAKPAGLGAVVVMILFWWSADYWTYGKRLLQKVMPQKEQAAGGVNRNTWKVQQDTVQRTRSEWKLSEFEAFKGVYMPTETIEGIRRIKDLEVVQEKGKAIKVLNMSELTPLAREMGYTPERNKPLWYHKSVAIFDKEINEYCEEIKNEKYDLVLFEYISYLNNFYPDEIRACLAEHYQLSFKFLAPREIQNSYIEVYLKPVTKNEVTANAELLKR